VQGHKYQLKWICRQNTGGFEIQLKSIVFRMNFLSTCRQTKKPGLYGRVQK